MRTHAHASASSRARTSCRPSGCITRSAASGCRTVREDEVSETGTGGYIEAQSHWRPWLRTTLGIRGDVYTFDVSSDQAENSGRRTAAIVEPEGVARLRADRDHGAVPERRLGFHSNDARGTTITVDPATGDPAQRVDPLVRSRGAEIGLRANSVPGWRTTLAVWTLNLDSELLFTGDGGTTEPSDRSRRSGVTLANFYRPVPQLSIDADVSFAHARFAGVEPGADHIPGALENVLAAGATWAPRKTGPFGALRVRHFGSYPLVENNSVRATATTLVNGSAGYQLGGIRVQARCSTCSTLAPAISSTPTHRVSPERRRAVPRRPFPSRRAPAIADFVRLGHAVGPGNGDLGGRCSSSRRLDSLIAAPTSGLETGCGGPAAGQ